MKLISDSESHIVASGVMIFNYQNLNFIGESILLGSFCGFLVSPIVSPHAIIILGVVGGVCATTTLSAI